MEIVEVNLRGMTGEKESVEVDVNTLKKVLNHDFKGEDTVKLLIFFMTLGSYRNSHQIIVLTGEILKLRTQLIKAIYNLHPYEYTYANSDIGSSCKRALVFKDWKSEKILYVTNYEKNRDLIHKFIEDEWSFSIVIKNKDAPKKSFTIEMEIPQMSILTTSTENSLNPDIERNALIIGLRNSCFQSKIRSEYYSYKSGNYAKIMSHNQLILKKRGEIKSFLKNLDGSYNVEIPYEILIRRYFNYLLPRSEVYHYFFLELIKNITFFHQNRRDWYLIQKNNVKVLLSHPEDLRMAIDIGKDIFFKINPNLEQKHINILKFISESLKLKQPANQTSSSRHIEFTRSKIISDYQDFVENKGAIPKSSKTYENYLSFLVKKNCLACEKRSNVNFYRLKNTPSLKETNSEQVLEEANILYNERLNALLDDSNMIFYKNEVNIGD